MSLQSLTAPFDFISTSTFCSTSSLFPFLCAVAWQSWMVFICHSGRNDTVFIASINLCVWAIEFFSLTNEWLMLLKNAVTTSIFDGDLKFNRASLYQMCETKQCPQACYFWKCQHYPAITLWCEYISLFVPPLSWALIFSTCKLEIYLTFSCWLVLTLLLIQGVLEAIRISCAGYPTRRTFYEFLNRFGVLAPEVLEGK